MHIDPNNPIVKLCAEGMQLEGEGRPAEAALRFVEAWQTAGSNFEKCIAAHYVARHQDSVADKLHWDERALELALTSENSEVAEFLPSLYLNIAKGYEDLHDLEKAGEQYKLARACADALPADGYGQLIKAGIEAGIRRVCESAPKQKCRH